LVKRLNKCKRSAQFYSVIMEIWISGVTAAFGITHMRWFHHQFELGGNSSTLRYWVGWFRRKLPVNFRHQTSYLSHVFRAVRIKSQFDIYFTNIKQLNKKWSKLNEEFHIFRSVGKSQVHIHNAQLVTCWEYLIEFSSKNFVFPPSPNPN
jgi:hypothetical protein